MRFNYILAFIIFALNILADLYIFKAIRNRLNRQGKTASMAYAGIAFIGYACLITAIALPRRGGDNSVLVADMWLIFLCVTMFLSKFLYILLDLPGFLPKLFKKGRAKWPGRVGAVCAVALFATFWWGALVNRNRITVVETTAASNSWPAAFDGYRIAQISDLHVGTWGNDTTFLARLVDRVNALEPDLIVFTGDIVNRQSDEFEPMVPTFSHLHARDGVYAIMGNHDYGDYRSWDSDQDHIADREHLQRLYQATGHRLLLNETVYLSRGNDTIALIGVENIGDPPFRTYGDLQAAYHDTSDSLPKILLTHNPAHWTHDIKDAPSQNIPLTLSGHTHAMQIQVAGATPSSWRYDTPWGMYTDTLGRKLYVNRGAGTVGIPMRIGATPEITLITLMRSGSE
ncbi:MAG: metallophosphoesterase [Clostridiales bacterium]|nr:metallophosphoesterase [Clostridiales bacterium]